MNANACPSFALVPTTVPAPVATSFAGISDADLATMRNALLQQLADVDAELRKRADAYRTAAHGIATALAPRRRGWRR